MTKDLTNGEVLMEKIWDKKEDFDRSIMFSGDHQIQYLEFSRNLRFHLEDNDQLDYFYKYCNFCGKFKDDEKLYDIDRLDFIDEKGKMPENYNYLHYPDSICETCIKYKYNNSIKPCKKCDDYYLDYKSKNICNSCKREDAAEILQGYLQGYLIRKKKRKIKKPKNKKNKKKQKKISKKNKLIKIKIIQAFIRGYNVRENMKPSILTLNHDCISNILECNAVSNQKEEDFFENIDDIANKYSVEVYRLLRRLNLDFMYCGYCNKFVDPDMFLFLEEQQHYDLIDQFNYFEVNRLCDEGICIYCNEKLLNNDLHYCELCEKVSDLTNKDSYCPCIENKEVKIRDCYKINKYVDHAIDKRHYLRKLTYWPESADNVHYIKFYNILKIPQSIDQNIIEITRYLENWWWELDAENCLCEECRNKLLLENSADD